MTNKIKVIMNSLKALLDWITPILYLLVWIYVLKVSKDTLGLTVDASFQIITLIILFIGVISKSTSWNIGHEKFGIKGDTLGRTNLNVHFNNQDINIEMAAVDCDSAQRLLATASEEHRKLVNLTPSPKSS